MHRKARQIGCEKCIEAQHNPLDKTHAVAYHSYNALFSPNRDSISPDLGCVSLLNQGNSFRSRESCCRKRKRDGCCRAISLAQVERGFSRFEITSKVGRPPCGGNGYRKDSSETYFDWIDAGDFFPSNSKWAPERVKTVYSLIIDRKEK